MKRMKRVSIAIPAHIHELTYQITKCCLCEKKHTNIGIYYPDRSKEWSDGWAFIYGLCDDCFKMPDVWERLEDLYARVKRDYTARN